MICTKCFQDKNVDDFNDDQHGNKRNSCKVCQKAYNKAYYLKNKERLLAYQDEYRLNNNEQIMRARFKKKKNENK